MSYNRDVFLIRMQGRRGDGSLNQAAIHGATGAQRIVGSDYFFYLYIIWVFWISVFFHNKALIKSLSEQNKTKQAKNPSIWQYMYIQIVHIFQNILDLNLNNSAESGRFNWMFIESYCFWLLDYKLVLCNLFSKKEMVSLFFIP